MNKVLLTGRITRDPEVRYLSNGTPTVSFSIAVDRTTRDQNGQRQADFINCVAWNQQADFISRYIKKGNMLGVVGRISTRSYQGQDGQTHYVTEVTVEQVEGLSSRTDSQAQPESYQQNQAPSFNNQAQSAPRQYQGYQNPTYGEAPSAPQEAPKQFDVKVDDDDLPF
jgi:single-strand DNA-binding protein